WLVLQEQRINGCVGTEVGATVVHDTGQDRGEGLRRGAHVVWPLFVKAVKIFFQDQLAMAGNEQAVNIKRIVGGIGSQNPLDQSSNGLLRDPDVIKCRGWPAVASDWFGVCIFCGVRSIGVE